MVSASENRTMTNPTTQTVTGLSALPTPTDGTHPPARIARRRITTILALGRDIKALHSEIDQAVAASGTTLVDIEYGLLIGIIFNVAVVLYNAVFISVNQLKQTEFPDLNLGQEFCSKVFTY